MKVRHFIIRLAVNQLTEDESHLNDFLENVDFVKSDTHFVESKASYWSVLIHYNHKAKHNAVDKSAVEKNETVEVDLNANQKAVYAHLKAWRASKAQNSKIPSYTICHNSELLNAIINEAKTTTDLKLIKGFGEFKVEKYGDEILSIINAK